MANRGLFLGDKALADCLAVLTRPKLQGSLLTQIRKFLQRYFIEGAGQDWVSISVPDSAG